MRSQYRRCVFHIKLWENAVSNAKRAIYLLFELGVGACDFIVLRATSYPRAFLASTPVRISIQMCYGKQAFAVLSATRLKT